ncbi:MAG: sugar phosphate isomerase/epimerase [Armatimonadetes bacterium]|nr:sugar phosphate isomerase/epimerase [Armatimonadota bacterium]
MNSIGRLRLALSGRVAEAPHEKTRALVGIAELADAAARIGYEGLEIRNSQLDVDHPPDRWREVKQALDANRLTPCCLVADSAIEGRFTPRFDAYLDLALKIGAAKIRPSIGSIAQIPVAQAAADRAAAYGVTLVQFVHHGTPFASPDGCLDMLRRINRRNVGLAFEPGNLVWEGHDYGPATIRRLAPFIVHAEVQNIVLTDDGVPVSARGGHVRYKNLRLDSHGGIDFAAVIRGLKDIGYDGWLVVHSPNFDGLDPLDYARASHDYLRRLTDGA